MNGSFLKILLTGPPGCGKTTVVKKVLHGLRIPAAGFTTDEVRGSDGRRIGFDIVMLDGRRGPLARVGADGERIGRYGVSLDFLEEVALGEFADPVGKLVVIDEIGRMECLSGIFRRAVRNILDGRVMLLGTVAMRGSSFISAIRSSQDVELIEVTKENREGLVEKIRKKVERGM